jgi:hypothetical protein
MRGLGKSLYCEAGGSSSERVTYPGHEQTCITTQSVTHARSPAMRVLSTFPPVDLPTDSFGNSPLVGPKEMQSLKLAKVNASESQTVVPQIDS